MTKELLLGFDARISYEFHKLTPPSGFLIRQVDAPLSVDRNIWPEAQLCTEQHLETDDDWRGPNVFLWSALDDLLNCLKSPQAAITVLAVTVLANEGWLKYMSQVRGRDPTAGFLWEDSTQPRGVQENWLRLGYDVADGFLISALMNCGYDDDEWVVARKFSSELNRYHLFCNSDTAFQYLEWREQALRGHTPLFAIGLYGIVNVDAASAEPGTHYHPPLAQ